MNKFTRQLAACAVLALAASQTALAQHDKAVDQANTAWNTAFNKRDAHGLANMYDKNAVVSPGNGTTVQGRADIEKLFKSYFDAGVHDHTIDVVQANRVGNVMYETANWTAVAEKDGKKTPYKGVLVKVMTKGADGKWRTTAHTWNAAQ
ncbi:SgcJ/EcaC family oxidoreductase [Caballeronia novacaledonica]|uniref:SgcJ/EcaC family oxidoreductase n=1 Tax=Caballeronia novacaledonica TaxID=1544861 RepID=A0AA37MRG8_9BURK|nr:SgcJ/EcaC family oxidoreductase [Caballeronia novacaledonica]GJH24179.1 SgcJ/EcaC family oxidoreductase [Caballeronia novacaledonica]